MATRFFVGRVFRIALAGIIESMLHVVVVVVAEAESSMPRPHPAGILGSMLHVVGRCRMGLLSQLFESFSLFGECPIAFSLLIPPELSEAGAAIALIGESPLPPPGGRETFWRAVSVEVMIRLKAPFARLEQAHPRTNSAEMILSRLGLGNKLEVDQREPRSSPRSSLIAEQRTLQ